MDDALDREQRRVLWAMPSGLYVVGSRHGDQRNAMTLNLAIQVSSRPRRIGIAVANEAFTRRLIDASGLFVLNVLSREHRGAVRKFVKPVEVDEAARTVNGFAFTDSPAGVPVLDIAIAWMECSVHQAIDAGDHVLFLGNVTHARFKEGGEGQDVLRMEDTRMNYGG